MNIQVHRVRAFIDGITAIPDLYVLGQPDCGVFAYASRELDLMAIADQMHDRPAREIVDAIFTAVNEFRGDMPPNDDTTAVVVRVTG